MKLKLGYFADGPWAHQTFKKLIADQTLEIKFICVRYDVKDSILISFAHQYQIDLLFHNNINSTEFMNMIALYQCDLFVSMSFNQIFKSKFLQMPLMGTINCHAGKLPFYRGRNVLNWVLINDEKEFGITVHYMDEGIDTGDIILQKSFLINDADNYSTLLQKAYGECANLLYKAIKLIQTGQVKRIEQKDIDPVGTYYGQRMIGDEIIDWNQSSRDIFNFIRALCTPGPQATAFIKGHIIRINRAEMVEGAHNYKCIVGQIVGKSKEGFFIKTKDNIIEIMELSCDYKLKIGDRLFTPKEWNNVANLESFYKEEGGGISAQFIINIRILIVQTLLYHFITYKTLAIYCRCQYE